jgi:hypothetical protein
VYSKSDWAWFNAGNTFLDAEVCAMICPRPLYIEVAKNDQILGFETTVQEGRRIRAVYDRLGISQMLEYVEFEGKHEFNPEDTGVEFLCKHLQQI